MGVFSATVVRTSFLFRPFEVDVVCILTLFVVHTGSNLCTVFAFTVGVLEAPVADFEVTSLRVLVLLVVPMQVMMLIIGVSLVIGGRTDVDAPTDVMQRVNHLTGVPTGTVSISKALSMSEHTVGHVELIVEVWDLFLPEWLVTFTHSVVLAH